MVKVGTMGEPMDMGEDLERKRLLEAAGSCLLPSPLPAPVPITREDAQGYPGPAFSLCSQVDGGESSASLEEPLALEAPGKMGSRLDQSRLNPWSQDPPHSPRLVSPTSCSYLALTGPAGARVGVGTLEGHSGWCWNRELVLNDSSVNWPKEFFY